MPQASILTRALKKSFGRVQAVQALNLSVYPGEIYGLVGPDGAGKTTSMRLLCGAITPDSGEVLIGGDDMLAHPEQARRHIGYLAQRFALYEELTVLENLQFFAEVRGLSSTGWRPRCIEILEFVGLAGFTGRRAGQLSGGMKQKLGLATALVHHPQVLLLDEPTTGVDPVTRQDFWQLIIRLVGSEGVAVLVSTPYMDEAARCMRLGFLRSGRLLVEGTPAELRDRLAGRVLELYAPGMQAAELTRLRAVAREEKNVQDVQLFGDRAHLRVAEGKAEKVKKKLAVSLAAAGWRTVRLELCAPTLEDVFLSLKQADEE